MFIDKQLCKHGRLLDCLHMLCLYLSCTDYSIYLCVRKRKKENGVPLFGYNLILNPVADAKMIIVKCLQR